MAKTIKDQKRREQVEAGAYDGRFRTKIVETKRRKAERKTKRVDPRLLDLESEEPLLLEFID